MASDSLPSMILPPPIRQFYVHRLLVEARQTVLHDVLRATVGRVDPDELADDLKQYAPTEPRRLLQSAGIRDEHVFATPCVLAQRPSVLGYYRLLLGVSQKIMYTARTGMSAFKSMETRNTISLTAASRIPELCRTLNFAMGELVAGAEEGLSAADIQQLPLLMLGAQVDGSWRNRIGQKATKDVFSALKDIIKEKSIEYVELEQSLSLVNRSGRKVTIALAADPDVVITEEVGEGRIYIKVAIEIKGGTDQSNAHNRAGEAEKSHQKVKNDAQDFWTVISIAGMDMSVLRSESPSTKQWFDVTEVLERTGHSWNRLRDLVVVAMGI